MKTINFELSKKLNDLWLLDNIETKYFYNAFYIWDDTFEDKDYKWEKWINKYNKYKDSIKTLTLEETIEFLPIQIDNYYFVLWKNDGWYWCNYLEKDEDELYILNKALFINNCNKTTLLEAIEKMLEYLLDDNLLIK